MKQQKILFVCHGNICRSPMAEFLMKKLAKDAGRAREFEIDSVATSTEEIGNDMYPPAKHCLRNHGVPFEHRAARKMTQGENRDVADPWYTRDFEKTYADLCAALPRIL